ncbi:hypothetical protein J6590_069655 [Homalodisca vitripennis]|nr:hypothetical protein J6590_069655 [Homalodisca vitripennis]
MDNICDGEAQLVLVRDLIWFFFSSKNGSRTKLSNLSEKFISSCPSTRHGKYRGPYQQDRLYFFSNLAERIRAQTVNIRGLKESEHQINADVNSTICAEYGIAETCYFSLETIPEQLVVVIQRVSSTFINKCSAAAFAEDATSVARWCRDSLMYITTKKALVLVL